jgi:hypothetical protein
METHKWKELREKVVLATLKYSAYTINILIIAAIFGFVAWWILIILESVKM